MKQNIIWPAIVKMAGVDDLLYLDSQQVWDLDTSMNQTYHNDDLLIDSRGHGFQIQVISGKTSLVDLQQTIDLVQLDEWVRQHLVAMQQCCVYKVELENFEQGFQLIRNTQDDD